MYLSIYLSISISLVHKIDNKMEGPEKIWEEGEIAAKSREEGEKGKLGVGRIELGGRGLGNKK